MRILSVILIITLLCTFIHESLHHEDGPGTGTALLSHAGPAHHHDGHGHGHGHHPHPNNSEHDSDHHDEDSHDHQFRILITKKDPSARSQAVVSAAGMIDYDSSGDSSLRLSNRCYYIAQRCKPPSPEYLCAHVMLL